MQTKISFAALFLAFAMLATTGWSCSPGTGVSNVEPDASSDATAGWQTYRDDTYGVEFKYPQGWVTIPDTQQIISLLSVDFNAVGDESPDSGITFSIDAKTLAESIVGLDSDPDMEVVGREEVSVNGVRWVKDISKDRNTPLQFLGYFSEHAGRTYQFSSVYAGSSPDGLTNERDVGVLNDILSSFHFLD